MLGSGADIKIGTREFMLTTAEDSYLHLYENLYSEEEQIIGGEGKKTTSRNTLLWTYDNFVQGEGLRYYDDDQPARWWTGTNNPRIPGSITSPPDRNIASTITTDVTPDVSFFGAAAGRLWYLAGRQGWYSTDRGATWTENTDIETVATANGRLTGACSDGEYVYAAGSDTTGVFRGILRVNSTTDAELLVSYNGSAGYWKAIAVRDRYLYAWTGGAISRFDLTESLPITYNAATHNLPLIRQEIPSTTLYLDAATTDTSVVFLRGTNGETVLFEHKLDPSTGKEGTRTFWTLPFGFTGQKMCVSNGIIYVLGAYQSKIGLFGYSIANRQPLFLGYVGEANSVTNVRFLTPSYGAQVFMGLDDGTTSFTYIYDAEEDAFSQLDERTIAADGTLSSGITFENRRLTAAVATTSSKINRWNLDADTPTLSWDWDSAASDLGFPQDEKVLLGFHIVQDPSIAAGTVRVWYQLDEGTWVDSGTSSTAGAGHTYVPISTTSSTKKFRTLRMRMVGSSGCRVLSLTARCYVNTRQEAWRLKVDLKNEPGTKRHPSDRTLDSSTLRSYLITLAEGGNVVEFKDGRNYKVKSDTEGTGYDVHSVVVEFPKFAIDSISEGEAEIILRSVTPGV